MRYGLKPHHGSDSETIHYLSGGKNSFKVKVWETAMSSKSLHTWWWFYNHYDFLLKQASLKYCNHEQFHLNRILSKACMFPNFQKHNLVFNRCASSLPLSITESKEHPLHPSVHLHGNSHTLRLDYKLAMILSNGSVHPSHMHLWPGRAYLSLKFFEQKLLLTGITTDLITNRNDVQLQ